MKLIQGNIWDELENKEVIFCFESNSMLDFQKHLYMKEGSAFFMKQRFPEISKIFGDLINGDSIFGCKSGGKFGFIGIETDSSNIVAAFQTKRHWQDKKDLELIRYSVYCLSSFIESSLRLGSFTKIVMPFPEGDDLEREDVLKILKKLPDNVWVYDKEWKL